MNELTDRIISSHLMQRPAAHRAFENDQYFHMQIETARGLLSAVESAMQREGIPYDSAERVLNDVMQATLEGWERERLNRERLLLLADIDPSPLIARYQREREREALWEMNNPGPERPQGSEETTG